jgi:CheY-like chemotaxis protein
VGRKTTETCESQAKDLSRSEGEHILLVDDEVGIIIVEKLMLERLGYHVTTRTSSIEALECFRICPDKYNLVITDMAMPNMSGDKLSAELIKIRPDIPILLCTGFSEKFSEEHAVSSGIKGFLLKPVLMKDLSQKVSEMIKNDDGIPSSD